MTLPDTDRTADEPAAVAERYARRALTDRYSLLQPDVWLTVQERQRAMLRLFARLGWHSLADRRLLEVGCGSGGNLLEMLRLGFAPEHLSGVELLPDRLEAARRSLPPAVTLLGGDASQQPLPEGQADVVLLSTVFSSLLDDAFQQQLADAVWRAVKPGGGVLWYDFTVDNPRNPDVRGVSVARIRQLFPQGQVRAQRLTLAPPLGRAAARFHPALWTLLNALPVLRTHVLAWVQK
jgi:SAM-dependent methyltransferase